MVQEAEKYKEDDEKQKERIKAKNELESFAFNLKQTCDDEKLKDKIPAEDREKLQGKVKETLAWLDGNQTAEAEEFQDKQKELEQLSAPIMTKMYQQAGGAAGGMPPGFEGGMPGAGAQTGTGGKGPTIEEVD